jgi:hypothetical protein
VIASSRLLLALSAPLALLSGCKAKPQAAEQKPAASVSAPKQPAAARSAPPHATPPPISGCRVIQLAGEIQNRGQPLRVGAALDGRTWLDLPKDARIVVKHPSTGRELAVTGPARVRVCERSEEQVVLAEGTLRTTAGPGARPGAQVLVFTPVGSIRYGDADVEARVTTRSVNVRVFAGEVWLEPAFGAARQGPEHVLAKGKSALKLATTPPAADAVTACAEAAQAAASAADAVLSPADAGLSLGQRAAIQLKARQTARVLCRSALAVLGSVRDADAGLDLETRVNEAEALWQKVPIARSGP